MSFVNRLVGVDSQSVCKNTSDDLFNDNVAVAYFKAEEYINYYRSFSRVEPKRDISIDFIDSVVPLFNMVNDGNAAEKIDYFIKSTINIHNFSNREINDIAKSVNALGYNLLEISTPLTLETLKDYYKRACLKHHPDRGGKTSDMQIINEAYTQFHKLACEEKLSLKELNDFLESNEDFSTDEDTRHCMTPQNANEFFVYIGIKIIEVFTDIMAVDKAFEVLTMIYIPRFTTSKRINEFILSHIDLFEKLTIRLKKANYNIEAEKTFKIVVAGCDAAVARGLNYDSYAEHLHEKLDNPAKIRVIINHQVQLENAYRLGIIDDKNFYRLQKKMGIKTSKTKDLQDKILDFKNKNGFIISLCKNRMVAIEPQKLIPKPIYCANRYEHLSEEQKNEYNYTFTESFDVNLILKYLHVRVTDLLVELIYNYNYEYKEKILNEYLFLQKTFPKEELYILDKIEKFLATLLNSEREEKLCIFKKIDSLEMCSEKLLSFTFEFFIDNENNKDNNHEYKKPIQHSNDYLRFIQLSIDRINLYISTGSFNTEEEYKIEENVRNDDYAILEELEKSSVNIERESVIYCNNIPPDEMVKKIEPYILAAIETGKKMISDDVIEDIQIGYDINILTTAYAKLKNWENVKYWIELYYSLPPKYRSRSPKSEDIKIKSRLLRSYKELQKIKIPITSGKKS